MADGTGVNKSTMDELPESMRKRPRRQSIFHGSAREVSEDGDFVTLRQVRKKFQDQRATSRKLSKVSEEDSSSIAADSGIENSSAEVTPETPYKDIVKRPQSAGRPFSPTSDKRYEKLRLSLFQAVISGTIQNVEESIKQVENYVTLADDTMRSPENGMNILHLSLDKNRIDISKFIINNCKSNVILQVFFLPNRKGPRTALHQITDIGNLDLAKLLLSKLENEEERHQLIKMETEVQITGQRPRTFTSLHLAAFKGYKELVELYLDAGVHIDTLNGKKDSALLWAARWGHNETVRCMLERNADVHKENDKNSTALHWAVRYEHEETVKLLLTKGKANPNQKRKIGLVTPLHLASALGNTTIVSVLLEHGADVNFVIRGGETPIHHASKEGHLPVVEILLKHGANLDTEDEKGDRALVLAARNDHSDVVRTLISNGGDIMHKNHVGEDTWYHAMVTEDDSVLKALTEHFMFLKSRGHGSLNSPICLAASLGKCEKLKKLIKLGVDPLVPDEEGNTFLHHAALHNQSHIIKELHKKGNIDAQNKKKDTALHCACMKGHLESALALMANKAKSNIQNGNGQTALHIAASSPNSFSSLAEAVVQHTIKSHDWESVNATDGTKKNALHLAAKFAVPDVLWEFRLVRFKDKDEDGNTPLHDAVRPGDPEPLETTLDIYEDMSRDADINERNNKHESVLHLAASAGFANSVSRLVFYGADLDCEDGEGNTVLHRLVKATVMDSGKQNMYMNVVERVFHDSVRWWCNRHKLSYPSDNEKLFQRYQREAILCLVTENQNKDNFSVLAYASRIGADVFLSRLMTLPNVMAFKKDGKVYFDVTHMTPTTNHSLQRCCSNVKVAHAVSNIELLLLLDAKARAARVLDIPPVRQIERMYTSICAWAYAFFIILHITYMAAFTYVGLSISSEFRNVSSTDLNEPVFISAFVVVPLEPIIYLLFSFDMLLRIIKTKKLPAAIEILNLFCALGFSILTVTWLILVGLKNTNQDYVLSICLCLGWLFSISFTRGFRKIHFFYRMLLNIFIKDVSRFLIVYAFVLLAFGFALHALFQISSSLIQTYETPAGTFFVVFNLMIGMGELFDDTFATAMTNVGRTDTFAKGIYLIYVVVATIVLLNLLIAMMNDSYSEILRHQKVNWRVDSVHIGVGIENLFPWFPSIFGSVLIKQMKIDEIDKHLTVDRWYLVTTETEIEKYTLNQNSIDSSELTIHVIDKRLAEIENRVKNRDTTSKDANEKFDSILKMLNEMNNRN